MNIPSDVVKKVTKVITDVIDDPSGVLLLPAQRLEELGVAQLDRIEITMRLEELLHIQIDDTRFEKLDTIADVALYIHELIKANQ